MRSYDELEAAWQATASPPTTRGRIELVVIRLGGGKHRVLDTGELSLEGGLEGDRWALADNRSVDRQLTLMNVEVARLVCDGQPLDLPGDNVLVDLDLRTSVAPPGTRLRLGNAIVEVTEPPHAGCKKFSERFGPDALRWVNDPKHANRKLRGVNARVIEPGPIARGDLIEVIRPFDG